MDSVHRENMAVCTSLQLRDEARTLGNEEQNKCGLKKGGWV